MSSTSWSEVNLFRKCKQAHDYRYNQQLQRKRPITPMLIGKILHEMLDAYQLAKKLKSYDNDPWDILERYEKQYRDFFREEQEEHGDVPGNCARLFESYVSRYKDDGMNYEASEAFVATDLATDLRVVGYIDKVAVDANARRWLMDHKFHKNIPGPEDRFHELQLLIYIFIWNRWNSSKPADGICWDYVRTMPPTEPQLLQSGELSKKKNIRCDRATYEAAIKKHKLDPADYQDMLKHLEKNDSMFFERVFLPAPSQKQIDMIVEDFRTDALLIQAMKGHIVTRSMSKFNCQGCEFKQLCEAEVRGLDSNFVKKAHYMPKEKFDGKKGKKKASRKKKVAKKKAKRVARKIRRNS